ncbi:MAG: ATP-dependent helicase HrpB [Planctomycetes bacterium]|nr:ATP-dependent helicase HrpB [Planctomycetota bacterium]
MARSNPPTGTLPIDAHLPAVLQSLVGHPSLILQAPTGAGKTTRVPPALARTVQGQIILVEPRRLAVRAAARRMAKEWGCRLGAEVGYTVRMDNKSGPDTRVLVVTPGILLRRLLANPFLEGVGAVIFDEFHERGLDADLALAVARQVQREVRGDLKLVLMSATMDAGALSRFLGGAPAMDCEGRSYPVEIEHLPMGRQERLEQALVGAVLKAHERGDGHTLIFLPGVGEIRRAHAELESAAQRRNVQILELFGEMGSDAQDEVLEESTTRRWILATNVAESSVTVPGVTAVVDSGLHRRMELDPGSGLDRLVLTRISLASATQRSGRAGRTGPGFALRLWAAHEESAMAPHDPAEVLRVDPSNALLWLGAFGEREPLAFPWLQAPPPSTGPGAMDLLTRLGAWDPSNGITAMGKAMADLPLHPRLARLMLEGAARGVADRVALAAVLCSERWPFENARGETEHHSDSDLLDAVEALEGLRDRGTLHAGVRTLQRGPAQRLLKLAKKLESGLSKRGKGSAGSRDEAFLRAVAVAFRDRLARRRDDAGNRALMVNGRGVSIARESAVLDAPLFVCVDILHGKGDSMARVLSRVEPDWFGPDALRVEDRTHWDETRKRVVAHRCTVIDELVLEQKPIAVEDWEAAAECLAKAAAADPERALGLDRPVVASLLERIRFLAHHLPDLELPTFDQEDWRRRLPELVLGCKSFADLGNLPLTDWILGQLNPVQARALKIDAPTHFRLPKGREVRLTYRGDQAPILASRIQDFFGLDTSPSVARGRVRVLLHLLAPNGRPQQVTDDLQSFWDTTYGVVRKELRRRYPKHAWPEDPRKGDRGIAK